MKFLLFLTLPLYALDQLTKWLVVRNIQPDFPHPVIPGFFDLVYLTNTGAAFSAFSNNNVFFILLSVVVLVALVFFYRRGAFNGRMLRIGFSLLLAGILGNLTDRILHSHVIDFLLFDLHVKFANPWPAFNVADSCICVAAGIFIITSFRDDKKRPQPR
jgi:signal peptidase II